MSRELEKEIFRGSSSTFYMGAKLFPKAVRGDVERLYSFLRVADDYVDCVPQRVNEFSALRGAWDAAHADPHFDATPISSDTVDQRVIKNIVHLTRAYLFDPAWIESFWDSMQADIDGKQYQTLDDVLWYMYGSAEVVGLMMARIMHVPPEADDCARLQGRAMQWANFIRDIEEDTTLGRCYFPALELQKFGLADLSQATLTRHPSEFRTFLRLQIERQHQWQAEAQKGYVHIPAHLRAGVRAAARAHTAVVDRLV